MPKKVVDKPEPLTIDGKLSLGPAKCRRLSCDTCARKPGSCCRSHTSVNFTADSGGVRLIHRAMGEGLSLERSKPR